MRRVWVDSWQLECCGAPFGVGSKVSWTLKPVDREFLEPILGPAEAARVTDAEDHHGDADADADRTAGVVRSLQAVFCSYELREGASARTPVVGSGVIIDRAAADPFKEHDEGRRFLGYIVGLDTDDAAVRPGRA